MKIRKATQKDAKKISNFIIRIFKEFNGKHSTKEGIRFFTETYNKKNIEKKWADDYVIIMGFNGKIIGVGRAKRDGWITHCYIDKKYMRKGIGSILMNKLEKWIKQTKKNKVLLNSSPFASKFYKKLGYKQKGKKKLYHGILLYPMVKQIKK